MAPGRQYNYKDRKIYVPDLTVLDIEIFSGLDVIAACKLLHHHVVVLGVVTSNMTNLY